MKTFFKFFLTLFLLSVLTGCVGTITPTPTLLPASTSTPDPYQGTEDFPWWNDAVFYEIFVRSFRDSDGDGIGDFNGITEKLDYLQSLGIKGLWLMPINESSAYHGYHITDYYAVESEYGSLDDFKHLLAEAHKRDIKVIMDFVLNHTSDKHPWFRSSLTPGSEYRDWYVWEDKDPGNRGPWNQQVWYIAPNGQYYYAVFVREIPDLNYHNPAVREEAKKITSFWLEEVGIDGIRLDGVRYWVEDTKLADSDSNHQFLEEWGNYYRSIDPQAFSIGEAWTDNANVKKYTNTNKELDAAFNFDLSNAIFKSINESSNASVRFALQTTIRDFPEQDNANFLTNHDMNRVASQIQGNHADAKLRVAAGILLTAPGIPFLYYGEEIGMTGIRTSGANADIPIRSPMQWSTTASGFTDGTPWAAVNSDSNTINIQTQTGDPNSLLEFYRALIQLRNDHSALRIGNTIVADSNSKKLVAYLRSSSDENLLILINIDDQPIRDYTMEIANGPLSGEYTVVSLLDQSAITPPVINANGGFDAYTPLTEIPPYSIFVIQLTK